MTPDEIMLVAEHMETSPDPDRWHACFLVALECGHEFREAIGIADGSLSRMDADA